MPERVGGIGGEGAVHIWPELVEVDLYDAVELFLGRCKYFRISAQR